MSPPHVNVSAVDSLIKELRALVDRTINDGSRIGYFASLYLRITIALRRAILAGEFNDAEAVARLDAAFARRYLTAVQQYRTGDGRISLPWGVALGAIERGRLSILQHMALAINAHVNFDLGLATFDCFGAQDLRRMKPDFMKVNDVLASVLTEVENEIGSVSPILWVLERFSGPLATLVINFGLYEARAFAWRFAELLADADATVRPRLIDQKAEEVSLICRAILQDRIRSGGFAIVAAIEVKDVRRVIRTFDRGLALSLDPGRETEPRNGPALSGDPPPPGTGSPGPPVS